MAIRGTTSDVQCRRLPPAVTGLFGVTPILSSVSLLFLVSLPVNVQALGAPGTLVGQATAAKVVLTWTAPADDGGGALDGYNVYRCEEGVSACTPAWIDWVASGTTYTNDGSKFGTGDDVTTGTTYRYAVGASRGSTRSDWSNEVVVTAVTVGAPTGLRVTAEGDSSISLAWTAPADDGGGAIEAYNVYRCVEGDSPCTPTTWIAWVTTGTTYTNDGRDSSDDDVTTGMTYRYAVAAYRAAEGDWSNAVTATARTPTAPGAPGSLEGQATAAKVVLTWAVPGSDGGSALTAYTLYRGTGNACTGLSVLRSGLSTTGTTYTDSSVTGGTTYCYQVSASNSAGEGAKSGSAVVTAVAVGAPTGLRVTAEGDSSISLAWTAPADDGGGAIEAYNVYRCVEGDSPCTPTTWIAWVDDGTVFTDTHDDSTAHEAGGTSPVVAGTTYRYAVVAYRAAEGDWSNAVTATARTPTAPTAPTAPGSLKGQAAADRVRLVWVAPGDDGGSALTGYDVYRGTGNTCTGLDVIRNVLDAGIPTGEYTGEYIDSNVVEGETYCYRVSASNSAGEGAQSGAAVVTAVTVGAPGGLRVSAASGAAISLSWTAPADDGGGVLNSYGYGVYRCVEGTSTCVLDKPTDPLPDESSDLLAWVTSETTTFTDDQVTEGKTYRYGVIASRAGKHSSWSNIVTQTAQAPPVALPKPPTPTGLTITSASDTSISLSWAAPTDDGNGAIGGYNVYRCDESSSSDCSDFPWLAWVAVPGNTEYTDTTVAAGTTYRYAVAAYRYDGTSAEPNSASDWSDVVTQTAQAPPGAPGSLEGQATAAKVVLTWAVPGSAVAVP